MNQNGASANSQLKLVLSALELQVELHERQRFKLADGVEQIAGLLKLSMVSSHEDIKRALNKVIDVLTPAQKSLLESRGVSFGSVRKSTSSSMSYRGSKVTEHNAPSQKVEDEFQDENVGKKKIIYRGQVKWV